MKKNILKSDLIPTIFSTSSFRPTRIVQSPPAASHRQLNPIAVCARQAAVMLNVSEPTLRKLTKEGKIPHTRVGRKVLYSIENLQKFLNN
jgi:excisionase family DNA binding protein